MAIAARSCAQCTITFYRGPVAHAVADYHARHGGFVTREDLAGFEVPVAESIHCTYKDLEVHTCDVWCQGVVMLETLKILEGMDLKSLGHNSLNYVHMVSQALGLAFADREAYLGDPKFVDVPTAGMVSDAYGALQRARIDPQRALQEMAAPGNPREAGFESPRPVRRPEKQKSPMAQPQDTIYGCTVDRQGNAYSCTPSDNQNDTPIIPGTGLTISSRGNQSRLIKGTRAKSSRVSARDSRHPLHWRFVTAKSSWLSARRAATYKSRRCCRCCSTSMNSA
jgi:gamma-glutamyltranspeptidase/glutathione hydrolase